MDFFIAVNGQQRGPFAVERLAAEGMTASTLVWRDGMPSWQPASAVPELAGVVAQLSPAPMMPVAPVVTYGSPPGYQQPYGYGVPPDVSSKKVLAGIMGIVLGGWGVHRFILGDPVGGVIRIVITFATCGLGSILCLIEGIIILTKTDADFYQQYILERKAWF